MPGSMKTIQFTAKGEARLATLPVGDVPAGHALVRVKAAGLCHTDIDVLHARYGDGAFPLVPGHEYAGVVEAIAADVAGLRIGTRVAVDPKNPLAHGYGTETDIFFSNSTVWKIGDPTNVRPVAWFNTPDPLRSGWAWGAKFLDKGVQMVEATVGKGRAFLFGNELVFRSQPHGSYKFFFNALYLSVAPEMKAGAGQ